MGVVKATQKHKQNAIETYVFRAHYSSPNDLAHTTYCVPQIGLSTESEQDLDKAVNYFYGNIQDQLEVAFEGPGAYQYLDSISVHIVDGESDSHEPEIYVKEYFF